MTGHTKEPWDVFNPEDRFPGIDAPDASVVVWGTHGEDAGVRGETHDIAQANARRIVDCVNALAGIENPAAFVEAARGMAEAAKDAVAGNTMALHRLYDALTAFRSTLGEDAA